MSSLVEIKDLTISFPEGDSNFEAVRNISFQIQDGEIVGVVGVLNWSFIQAGYCDELSIVIAPAADGARDTQTLFMTKEGLTTDCPKGFSLLGAQVLDKGVVWLRYTNSSCKKDKE